AVLQLRSCLSWVCRVQRQVFVQLKDSQAYVLRQLLQCSVLLPQLQQAGLLLLQAMGPWAPGAVLPTVPFSFHIVPSVTRPSVCPPRAVSSLLAALGADPAAAAAPGSSSSSSSGSSSAAAETHVVTLSTKLPSLMETLRAPYTPQHPALEDEDSLPEEPMPLFLLCRLRISAAAAAGAAGAAAAENSFLGLATGHLSMGPSETVVADAAAEEGGDEAAGDVLRVWRQVQSALAAQLLQQLAAAEAAAAGEKQSAAGSSSGDTLAPLLALRMHQLSAEVVRMEEIAELLSLIARASLSTAAQLRGAAAEAAAALSLMGLPVYSLIFECLDYLLAAALRALEGSSQPAEAAAAAAAAEAPAT
ncbi:hypothetical protein, conserved, partial [Eimeria tenella]